MQLVAIVDYGMGNLRSVYQALCAVSDSRTRVIISQDAEQIAEADKVIVPGQGAAKACMHAIQQHQLREIIVESAQSRPFLGICMGLQVLMASSDENDGVMCLGLYGGGSHHFHPARAGADQPLKIPHMGWNQVKQTQSHPLWHGIDDEAYFYFVHSYFVQPEDDSIVCGTTRYGIEFASAICRDQLFAIQCHPEKSADDGLQLLRNFVGL